MVRSYTVAKVVITLINLARQCVSVSFMVGGTTIACEFSDLATACEFTDLATACEFTDLATFRAMGVVFMEKRLVGVTSPL